MTPARPSTVLSTYTNDYAISRYHKMVETKTAKKNSDTDTVIKMTFLFFSKIMKINSHSMLMYHLTQEAIIKFFEISILSTFDHNNFKCGFFTKLQCF